MPATFRVRVTAPGTPADEAFATLLGQASHCLPVAEGEFEVYLRDLELEADTGEAALVEELDAEHPDWREYIELAPATA